MKKILASLLALLMLCALMTPFAAFADGNVRIVVDGTEQNYAVAAFTKKDRTLAPMDEFFKALNATYTYDAETKKIEAASDDFTVTLKVDSTKAEATRYRYTLDVAAMVEGDTVMVPVRFVAQQLGYKVDWDDATRTVTLKKYNLTSTLPTTQGQKNVLARAKQLSDFKFTPSGRIPTKDLEYDNTYFEPGVEYTGVPYASCEVNNKFIGENVTLDTLASAIENPDSVMYTKDMLDYRNGASYYGLVCNGHVRYSLGIAHQRYNTAQWMKIPGMREVCPLGQIKVEDLQVCDILHVATAENTQSLNHVALISDILRDENGEIVMVEVSESTFPTTRRRKFLVEDFYAEFEVYRSCRYDYIESVPPADPAYDNMVVNGNVNKPMIAVDNGDKSNYLYGDETVISVFADGKNTVQILRDDKLVEEIAVEGYTQIKRTLESGYYVAKLANTEHATEFCVCKMELDHALNNNMITVTASSAEGSVSHMEFRNTISGGFASLNKMIDLTAEEKASGVFTREMPETAITYRVTFENKYGHWTQQVTNLQNPDIYISYKLSDGISYKSNEIIYAEGSEKPQVTSVKLADPDAKYELIHEENRVIIRVTDAKGTKDWYLNYKIGVIQKLGFYADDAFTEHKIVGLSENATHSKNVWPEGICDNDYTTMWGCTVIGDSLVMDLGEVKDITHFAFAQWEATKRTFYFQVLVSEDGENYTLVKDVASYPISGTTDCQIFPIEPCKARYVKIYNSGGNTTTKAQNMYEFKILQQN